MTTSATTAAAGESAPKTAPRAAIFIVFLVVFIDLLGFGIVLPLLPRYSSTYLGVLPASLRGATLGMLFSIFSLMQFVFSPMWGRISDRIGRRPVLLVGLCGSVVFYGLFGYASDIPVSFRLTDESFAAMRTAGVPDTVLARLGPLKNTERNPTDFNNEVNAVLSEEEKVRYGGVIEASRDSVPHVSCWLALGLLFFSRMGAGIAGASVSSAAAVIADCTTLERRAKGMALIGAAFGFGFTFGPLIGYLGLTVFDQAHWAPGILASLLSLVALLLALRLLPETRVPGTAPAGKELFSISRTAEVLRMPTIGALVLIYFLVIFGFANFEGTLSMFTSDVFHQNEQDNFLVFAFVGFVLMLAQGGFYRPLVGRLKEERMLSLGVGLMIFGLAGLGAVAWLAGTGDDPGRHKVSFYCAMTAAVFGFAFVNPSVSALVSRRSDPRRQGEVLGVNQAFSSLGRILGPLIGLILFRLGLSHTLPYLAGVITLAVVVLLLPRVAAAKAPLSSGEQSPL